MSAAAAGPALRAFLEGLIDYAGLFPPARLDLAPAVEEFVGHFGGSESWMLGRFIVPAARFGDLLDRLPAPGAAGPFRLAVLAGGGATEREALDRILAEAAALNDIGRRHAGKGAILAIETRLPRETLEAEDAEHVRDYADDFRAALAGSGLAGIPAFFEVASVARYPDADRDAAVGLADAGEAGPSPRAGFKLRCGGPEPSDVPSAGRIARVIAECRDRGVPLKCTAGLHQPLRAPAAAGRAERHGFLNVFVAAILAFARWIPLDEIEACVLEDDASSFRFDDDGVSWRKRDATTSEIERARRLFATGFGSCSFDEPREGLRHLRLLS